MRFYSLAILCASGAFIALPALAQTTDQTTGSNTSNHTQSTEANMNPRQELMHDLQKAGFTDIRIAPEAFIVHAKNSQGEPVLMRIGPDSMESVTALQSDDTGSKGQSATNSKHSSNTHASTTTE